MADLLLELFSEEIPARMQRAASEAMQAELQKALAETSTVRLMYFADYFIRQLNND